MKGRKPKSLPHIARKLCAALERPATQKEIVGLARALALRVLDYLGHDDLDPLMDGDVTLRAMARDTLERLKGSYQ